MVADRTAIRRAGQKRVVGQFDECGMSVTPVSSRTDLLPKLTPTALVHAGCAGAEECRDDVSAENYPGISKIVCVFTIVRSAGNAWNA